MSPLVITAFSLCNAMGMDTRAVLRALAAGQTGLAACPSHFGIEATVGALPDDLPALPRALVDRDTRLTRILACGLVELRPAIAAACKRFGGHRIGVVLGTSTGGIGDTEHAHAYLQEHGDFPENFSMARSHALDSALAVVRELVGITGPSYVVSTACSSSAKVLATAQRLVGAGLCDAVVAGGVDSLCQLTLRGFAGLGLLSREPCRPFSNLRNGINIGEGAALMLVARDGEGPGRLLGVGESSDAYHMTSPHPEGLGARLAMQRALEIAGVEAGAVDHINAHATGTRQNDQVEGQAIADLFGQTPVIATKGYTGHMLGAAGATEVLFSLAAITRGELPVSVGSDPLDPGIPIRVPPAATAHTSKLALSNSFAFGGSNVSVLIGGAA